METSNGSGRLNNAQRKALAQIVVRRFDERLDAAKRAEEQLEREITQELFRKFGIATVDGEITRLEAQIKNLKERKEELGFDKNYDGTYRIRGGQAKELLEAKVSSRSLAIRTLKDERNSAEQDVWLATTVDEAKEIADMSEEAA